MGPRRPAPNPTWESTLHSLRLTGTLYCRAELSAPWGIAIPELKESMLFGIVTEGSAWVEHGRQRRKVGPGSLWLFPGGGEHRVFSDAEAPVVPLEDLPVQLLTDRYEVLHHGGGGERTQITYGVVRFDEAAAARLVSSLPDVLHIEIQDDEAGRWLASTIELITHEAQTQQLGGETVLTRLADVIVIQAIRSFVNQPAARQMGWLVALRDEHVGRALSVLHQSPGVDWTLKELARVAGMSRSVFALRFAELVGEPPMTYLTWLRMETARARLRDTDESVASLAASLGYGSEAAFGRTFKRLVGTSPGRFRKSSRAAS